MNEILILIIFFISTFIVIPFIIYCIMVFYGKYNTIDKSCYSNMGTNEVECSVG